MALSPAQRHSQRMAMEQQQLRREAVERAESLHLQIQALNNDIACVRNLPTIANREAYKRDVLLPRWMPTVESYLEGGKVYPNPVFAWCVVWLFDAGDFEKALAWADTIDLLAQLASQCASHSHPGTGGPTTAAAFSQTATQATQTRSRYESIIA
ncbi:phage terminase small subunit [Cronobacter dublinensis]|uniref:phage terminase small subunit n=1 Tax=Cronobacter dublinensis TaxID=413497 RepID=UPI000CFD8C70